MSDDRLWANPTIARRDGGWSWLVIHWHARRTDECWAPASVELDAVIAAARGGATRDELCNLVGGDGSLIAALVDGGVLSSPGRVHVGDDVEHEASRVTPADAGTLLATFARDHGDSELPLLDAVDTPVSRGPLLDDVRFEPLPPAPAAAHPAGDALVADVVMPDGPAPRTAYAIGLAPGLELPGVTWLALDDLRVSIVDEQLVLRSVALGRPVIPRLPRAVRPEDPALLRMLAVLGDAPAVVHPDRAIATSFPLGGEWLEVKLYTSRRLADLVIAELVRRCVTDATAAGWIDDWHFLRYADPRSHVRLRLHGTPRTLVREVLPMLCDAAASWIADDRVTDLQVGTYRREVDRYGGAGGALVAERIFTADSACVSAVCDHLASDDEGEDARWRIAALGIEQLVTDVVAPDDVAAVHAENRDRLARRLGLIAPTAKAGSLAARLRQSSDLDAARAELHTRSTRIAPLVEELRVLERTRRLSRPITNIAGSLVHMFTNRLLRAFALEQELVLYELLARDR